MVAGFLAEHARVSSVQLRPEWGVRRLWLAWASAAGASAAWFSAAFAYEQEREHCTQRAYEREQEQERFTKHDQRIGHGGGEGGIEEAEKLSAALEKSAPLKAPQREKTIL